MWDKVYLEYNLFEKKTEKACLLNMPSTSGYKGYSFWHPLKCTRPVGKKGHLIEIAFTDTFEFKLKKYGNGKYNFNKVIAEKILTSDQFKECLGYTDEVIEDLVEED